MKLTVVIPALNEEDAIGSTIERCLAARERIVADSQVTDVEIIVVSDGSTDRTVEIASTYSEIRLIEFEHNRGYGAAIKRGFEVGTGELVGFLDADGTCDPNFFATLCSSLASTGASVSLGSRMGPQSKMPRVRRLGNRMYALILSALSNKVVTDTASGMRVIRRDALERLYPLPDGLHFTPAMSARVLMDDELTLTETPMTYEDRIGESKLHVLHDGMRFLRTILEMTLMWKPGKVFVGAAVCCALAMTVLAIHPIEMWLRNGSLQEDMIYRLLFCSLLGTFSATLFSCGIISEHLRRLLGSSQRPATFLWATMDKVFTLGGVGVATLCGLPILTWLVGEGIWTRATAGYVDLHWSRVVLAGLVVFGLVQTFATVLIVNLIRFHTQRKTTSVHAGSVAVSTKTHIAVPTPPRRTAVPVMS